MAKVVYNACYGGFSLSLNACKKLAELKGVDVDSIDPYGYGIDRHDAQLVKVVEELGKAANGSCAKLAIRELETGTRYYIDEYDGLESVITINEYDWKIAE